MIASISTSKRQKGFLQLSLDASGRLYAFLSITLKVAVEWETEKEFVGESAESCLQTFPIQSLEVSITFAIGIIIKVSRQKTKDRKKKKKVGRINWCRYEFLCVGLCCFSVAYSERQAFPSTAVGRKLWWCAWNHQGFTPFAQSDTIICSILEIQSQKIILIFIKEHHKLSQSSVLLRLTPDWSCALRIAASHAVGRQHDPNILA